MKANKIITTLGCLALILLSLYFVYGVLKISGQGLASLSPGPLIEGMSDSWKKKYEKLFSKTSEKADAVISKAESNDTIGLALDIDSVEGFGVAKKATVKFIEMMRDAKINSYIADMAKRMNTSSDPEQVLGEKESKNKSKVDTILRLDRFLRILKEYSGSADI